ncbi:hypothetical protein C8J56DRAFT_1044154 [Mycena floridula]|nr:hypothetical protein C8J56DRAFT_1044154 [Mycena floridula]
MDQVVKVVGNLNFTPRDIHTILSKCGKIHAIYEYCDQLETETPTTHFFINFTDAVGPERAVALRPDVTGLRIFAICKDPHLIEQYRAVNPSAVEAFFNEQKRDNLQNLNPRRFERDTTRRVRTRTRKPYKHNIDNTASDATPNIFSALRSTKTPLLCSDRPLNVSRNPSPELKVIPPSASHIFSFSTSLVSGSPSIGPIYAMDARVTIPILGELMLCDLRQLEADPEPMIQLLNKTESERGTWMIVGAQYRRMGNPSAAIKVISGMVETMSSCNVQEAELKPAFLLLSGCELDLAKACRNPSEASEHYKCSQTWLQKVYGTMAVPQATAKPIMTLAPTVAPDLPAKPDVPLCARSREPLINAIPLRVGESSRGSPDSFSPKIKAEDDLAHERESRRRLERQLAAMKKERDHARRMESYAQEQVRNEVESRRRAEDHAQLERDRRLDAEGYWASAAPR